MTAVPELARIEGKYEIVQKLREGGMGAIYLVRHRLLEEFRVIKVIRPQLEADEALKERFLREARSAVRLRHPNIAQIYDFTMADDGMAFMVMEFIDGEDLARRVQQRGKIGVGLALEVGIQTLRALEYLHRQRFIHRDISPDNLMLTRDVDGRVLVKLIDLGIAKPLESARTNLTQEGFFLGKIKYASPEQFRGGGESGLDQRSDLYSLGIVLYEVLTGAHPIEGRSSEALVAGHLFQPPVPFTQSDPESRLPEPLRAAILKSLEKDPEARHASAEEFARTLQEIQKAWSEPEEDSSEDFSPGRTLIQELEVQEPEESAPGGTTQNVLDEFFAPVRTAPPIAPAPGLPRERDPNATKLASLVDESEQLAAAGDLAGATRLIREATQLAPDRTELADLLTELESRLAAAGETVLAGAAGAAAAPAVPAARPEPRPAPRRGPLLAIAAAAAVLLVFAVVLLWPGGDEPTSTEEIDPTATTEAEPAKAAIDGLGVPAAPRAGAEVAGLLESARASYAEGRDREALDAVRAVHRIDPENAEVGRLTGELLESAESELSRSRRTAERADAARLAPTSWRAAERSRQQAEAVQGDEPLTALESFWAAADQYDTAAAQAERARAAEQARTRQAAAQPSQPRQEVAAPEPTAPEPTAPTAAATEAAATTTPAVQQPAQPVDETPAIRSALQAFTAAQESLDIGALQAIWPSISGQRLNAIRQMFDNARQIEMDLSGCTIDVNGDTARADCQLHQIFDPKRGMKQEIRREIRVSLRKTGGRWVIENY